MLITVIVPCYNESKVIPFFYEKIKKVMTDMVSREIEILFINDGSEDDTLRKIKELSEKDKHVKYLSLSRNFGKEAAMFAGLSHAKGDYVAIMDADLQDPPEMLPVMAEELDQGFCDCIGTRRVTRKGEPQIRSFFAKCFYRLINKMSNVKIVDGARDFRMMTRQMVDAIINIEEVNRFSKGIFSWVGFETKWLEYENKERVAGETKWSFWKLFKYSFDGITAFSTVPLAIASFFGMFLSIVSLFGIIIIIIRQFLWENSAFGWPSMVCIMLFLSGLQLLCLGIVSQYLAKTYIEVKKRPIYIIKESSDGITNGKQI